jgi:predicted nucleotidyltransferase component of viral defense system
VVPVAFVRQFAFAQEIALEVADQEIVLHYALALLKEAELIGTDSLLFKGGTALRKCRGPRISLCAGLRLSRGDRI